MAALDDLVQTIDLLYAAALDRQYWPAALDRMAEQTGGIGTSVVSVSQIDERALVSQGLHEAAADYVRHEWWRRDILREESIRRGSPTGLLTHHDVVSDEVVRKHPYFQEYLRKHGIRGAASYTAALSPCEVNSISVQRSIEKDDFEAQELRILNALGPHAARALRIGHRIADAEARAASLEGMLDRFAIAAVLIDRRARVGALNKQALDAMGDAYAITHGAFRATTGVGQRALDALMRSVFDGGAAALCRAHLPLRDGSPGFVAQAFMLPAKIESPFFPGGPEQAVLYLTRAEARATTTGPIEALRTLGLTPAEARVASIVGVGFSPAEAAEALNIKVSTVRLEMKSIFAKLGVRRQSELARLVSRLTIVR